MREVKQTAAFKRDLKREAKGQQRQFLSQNLVQIIQKLANDVPLGTQHRDHALVGEWKDYRDCHIRPDLVLIYRKPDVSTLQLVRLGSHAELSL
jgi:mRNA interferase YafQ